MCDPITLGLAAVSAGGSLFKGFAGADANNRSADMASANAGLLRTQAEIARGNADLAVTRGNYDQFLVGRKVQQTLGDEKAAFAGGHVDPTYGSPLMLQGYTAAQGEVDAQLTRARMLADRANALTQGANIDMQALGQVGKAAQYSAQAKTDMISGFFDAGTSFLNASRKWPGLDNPGASGGFMSGARFLSPDATANPWAS